MKAVVVGVLTFVLSAGGTAGAAWLQQRSAAPAVSPSPAAADSTKAAPDSAKAAPDSAAARADTAHADTAHADTAKAPAPKAVAPTPPETPRAVAKVVAAEKRPAYRQLSKVFGSMKAADAVQVLAYLSDEEVEGVLSEMGPKQAAELLSAFPKERAAALSRRILHRGARP